MLAQGPPVPGRRTGRRRLGGLTVLHNVRAASGAATRPTARTRRASAPQRAGASAGRPAATSATADCPPVLTYGSCTGIVPAAVPVIKIVMAAVPCNLPGHVDRSMRKLAVHVQRIVAAEPRPEDRFATDEARWRYEMAVLGPNMDYELLHHCADARGAKWAERLGASLPHVRALLPPLDPDAWRVWDGATLLAALREAIGGRGARPQAWGGVRRRGGAWGTSKSCSSPFVWWSSRVPMCSPVRHNPSTSRCRTSRASLADHTL